MCNQCDIRSGPPRDLYSVSLLRAIKLQSGWNGRSASISAAEATRARFPRFRAEEDARGTFSSKLSLFANQRESVH